MNRNFVIRSMTILLASVVLLSVVLCFRKADDPRITKILTQIEKYTSRSNLQKVYLKTDKEKYMSGETIWLKAYLLNALTLKPNAESNEIYVDLIGKNNEVLQNIVLKNNNGFAVGDIVLNDSLPEGNYQIVAYSNWMKNFDEAYFYSKTIEIVNPLYNNYLTISALSDIKQYNKNILAAEKEKTVQFFPEGGYMVAGMPCRVAFKAINNLGYGVNVKGEIFDDSDKRIGHFESSHMGMGSFNFTPEAGRKYYAKAVFDENETKKLPLPAVEPKGYVMMANAIAGDQIRLNIQSNIGTQMDEKNNEFIIVGQSRGEVRYIAKVVYKGKPINTSIPKKHFPAGIAQITIFDGLGTAVCERLVFIHPKEKPKTTVDVEKATEGGDLVYKIQLKNSEGKPTSGNVALSLTENIEKKEKWNENILANLLLTSDLKGRVENANYYFDEGNAEALMNIDYVMLVNGWRRFVWKEIMANQFSPLLYSPSEGIQKDEVYVTNLKPVSINLSAKAYGVPVNEQYDSKIIRKNTRDAMKPGNSKGEFAANKEIIDPATNSYSNLVDYMKGRVAGVTVSDYGIKIRGINSINSGTDPLILQDGSQIGFGELRNISPKEVSSIEVLKGSDASMYGVRGANGVILIKMRTGGDYLKSTYESTPVQSSERIITFYNAREFYVPAYDAWDKKPSEFNVPRSVFWKPNIAIDSTGTALVRFKNRGDVTNIKASIEGMAADGSILHFESAN